MKFHFTGLCQLQGSWWLLAFVLQCDMMPQECLQGTTAPKGPRHNVIAANQVSPLRAEYKGNFQPVHSLE